MNDYIKREILIKSKINRRVGFTMKKHEIQHFITVCENFPAVILATVVKDEYYKMEILDAIDGHDCKLIGNEIRFKNGNVIQLLESSTDIRSISGRLPVCIDELEF